MNFLLLKDKKFNYYEKLVLEKILFHNLPKSHNGCNIVLFYRSGRLAYRATIKFGGKQYKLVVLCNRFIIIINRFGFSVKNIHFLILNIH